MLEKIKDILRSNYTKFFLHIISSIGICCFCAGLISSMFIFNVLLMQKEANLIYKLLSSEYSLLTAVGVVFFCSSHIGFFCTGNTAKLVDKILTAKEDAMKEDENYINQLKHRHHADKSIPSLCFLTARSAITNKIGRKSLSQITEPAQEIVRDVKKIDDGPKSSKWMKHFKIN